MKAQSTAWFSAVAISSRAGGEGYGQQTQQQPSKGPLLGPQVLASDRLTSPYAAWGVTPPPPMIGGVVGARVGATVGATVGVAVGATVGVLVGATVGAVVGAWVAGGCVTGGRVNEMGGWVARSAAVKVRPMVPCRFGPWDGVGWVRWGGQLVRGRSGKRPPALCGQLRVQLRA